MNRQLSRTYEQIRRIETEITRLESEIQSGEDLRHIHQELTALHRQAEKLYTEPVLGINAHAAGAALGLFCGLLIYILLRRRERRKGKDT